jgi:hypothetical protein
MFKTMENKEPHSGAMEAPGEKTTTADGEPGGMETDNPDMEMADDTGEDEEEASVTVRPKKKPRGSTSTKKRKARKRK